MVVVLWRKGRDYDTLLLLLDLQIRPYRLFGHFLGYGLLSGVRAGSETVTRLRLFVGVGNRIRDDVTGHPVHAALDLGDYT